MTTNFDVTDITVLSNEDVVKIETLTFGAYTRTIQGTISKY